MQKFARVTAWTLRVSAFATIVALAGCMEERSLNDVATEETQVQSAADLITLAGTPPTEATTNSTYFYQPSADNGGSDPIAYSIENQPQWLNFDTHTGALSGVPSESQVGVSNEIIITATTASAAKSGTIGPFRITVKSGSSVAAANAAPTISGTAPTSVTVNQTYSFTPAAADPNGSALSFSIVNRPSWATFDTATGRLTGAPKIANLGTYSNIVIRVSDGTSSTALAAFSIDVTTAAAMSAVNVAPAISGSPATAITAGAAYSFTPSAVDVNSDTLSFSIQNKPSWATFSAATGQLFGTPASAGTTANIVISVSDGKTTTALSGFSITVANASSGSTGSALLSWTAPTVNADGSVLTDLAGFHVYYGKDPGNLKRVDLAGGNTLQYLAGNLDPGIWYFTISAYNSAGVESAQPAVVSQSI